MLFSYAQTGFAIEEIDGIKYYQHYVEAGQTLYALSKLYHVDEETIVRYNPHIKDGLKVDHKLLIPVDIEKQSDEWTNPIRIENGFIYHRVKRKETLFGIAQEYKVDVNDILANNQEANDGLAIGMTLKIPINDIDEISLPEDKSTIQIEQGDNNYIYHFIQPGETLYSLSIAYTVTTKSIEDLNDGLPEGLKAGEKIRVKRKPAVVIENTNDEEIDIKENNSSFENKESGVMVIKHNDKVEIHPSFYNKDSIVHQERYGISFMLPFYTNYVDRDQMPRKEALLQKIALNFYNGAMLAIDTLESYGLNADIYTYEISRTDTSLKNIFNRPEMDLTDLIIGPLNRKQLFLAAEESYKRNIHLVCPTPQTNKILLDHPNVSKVHPSGYSQIETLASYIALEHRKDNVIIINSLSLSDAQMVNSFKKTYSQIISNYPAAITQIPKEHKATVKNMAKVVDLLSPTINNIVVVPTKDKVVIQDLFTHLSRTSQEEYDITIYGMEEWVNYEFLDINYLNRFNTSITSPNYIDYNNSAVKSFIKNYHNKYHMEPDKYAFLGYDIMTYYGKGLIQYGNQFPAFFNEINTSGLLYTSMNYQQTNTKNGYENKHSYLLKFDEHTIIKKSIK